LKKILASFILFFSFPAIFLHVKAQPPSDSCDIRISLLTCTPGKELYSTFGHSALRVINNADHSDLIFNYGTFDFEDPDFYWKFVRGKLLYFVSIDSYDDFVALYKYEGRGITEQVLDLSCDEKQNLLAALFENAKEENKYYKYDFLYDNCTTRLRDMVAKYSEETLTTKNIRPYTGVTFRKMIHEYLNRNNQYWSKFGIDLIMGSRADKKTSNQEAMFLPEYLLKAFDSSNIGNKKLVTEKISVLDPSIQEKRNRIFSPLVLFSFLFLMILLLSFIKTNWRNTFFRYFDFMLFFLYGLLGGLLLFLWFFTDHHVFGNNLNILWAFPGHAIIAFYIGKKRKWLRYYFLITSVVITILSIFGEGPQEMNNAFFPLIILLLLRSLLRYKEIPK
jgi:hypothetical protein